MRSLLITLLLSIPSILPAHPISISWATLHASREKIGLQLNVLAEDLFLYHNLEAGENGLFTAEQLLDAAERHKAFLQQYFFLEGLQGQRFHPEFLRLQSGGIPQEGIHKDSLMQHSLLYFFEFKTPLSLDAVQVHQQFGGSRPAIPALVMVTAYQEGAPNSLTTELSREKPWLLRFNWKAPELFARKKGFASFAEKDGPSAYIRIDESGIRQELALPFEKLEALFPVNRKNMIRFSEAEAQQAQRDAIAFFSKRLKVSVNGQPVALSFAEVEFGEHNSDTTAPSLLPDTPVKISLVYTPPSPPSSVSVNWEVFGWQARSWKAEIYAFGKKENHTFSRYQPEYFWKDTDEKK